jgi:hypothetical protein
LRQLGVPGCSSASTSHPFSQLIQRCVSKTRWPSLKTLSASDVVHYRASEWFTALESLA